MRLVLDRDGDRDVWGRGRGRGRGRMDHDDVVVPARRARGMMRRDHEGH